MCLRSLILIGLVLLVLGITVAPISFSYVTTESMEPTIDTGDVYVLIHASNPTSGDIVTFESESYGGAVTHRIVEKTDRGYITQGDGNQITDQEGPLDPVTKDEIIGKVATLHGTPLIIPGAAPLLKFISNHNFLLLVLLLSTAILDSVLLTDRPTPTKTRSILTYGDIIDVIASVAFLSIVILLWTGSATAPITVMATENPSQVKGTPVQPGEPATISITQESKDIPGFYRTATAEGKATVESVSTPPGVTNARIRVGPYSEGDSAEIQVRFVGYPLTLPPTVIDTLHSWHPLLAATGTTAALLLPFYLIGRFMVSRRAPLRYGRMRRLRRWLS